MHNCIQPRLGSWGARNSCDCMSGTIALRQWGLLGQGAWGQLDEVLTGAHSSVKPFHSCWESCQLVGSVPCPRTHLSHCAGSFRQLGHRTQLGMELEVSLGTLLCLSALPSFFF